MTHTTADPDPVARLAGGVAHDFNNVIAVAKATLEDLADHLADDEGRRLLATMEKTCGHAARLTDELSVLASGGSPHTELLDASEVVEALIPMVRELLPDTATLQYQRAGGAAPIHMNRARLEQAILNLATHGRDLMPADGEIEIWVLVDPVEPWVDILVSDTGNGISASDLPHVFDPHYTTQAEGPGIGLAATLQTTSDAGGLISVKTYPGHGTTFAVRLPRVVES